MKGAGPEAEDGNREVVPAGTMHTLRRILGFFRTDWLLAAAGFGLLLLSTGAGVAKPWPLALVVDSFLGDKPLPGWLAAWTHGWNPRLLLVGLSVAVLFFHFAQALLAAAQNYVLTKAGLRGLARVREALFHWLLRLSLRFHHGSRQGDLIYRATWDTHAFHTFFQHGLFGFLGATLALGLMVAVMAHLNHALTLVALATVPPLLIVMRWFGGQMRRRGIAAHEADGRVASLLQLAIVALPLTRVSVREATEERRFHHEVQDSYRRRLSQHGWEIAYLTVIGFIFAAGTAGIVWVGARQVQLQHLSIGELLVFVAYLSQFYEPLNRLSHISVTLADAHAGTRRVLEILDTPEEVCESPQARPVYAASEVVARTRRLSSEGSISESPAHPPLNARRARPEPLALVGAICFEEVAFAYAAERWVLTDVSFALEPGQSLAVIGPNGSGKTTLLQLLPRLYDPSRGTVRLDGVDLLDLRLADLRRQITFVLQEPVLLAGSIAENIAFSRPEASRAEIEAAAHAAHADEFISTLPHGYDTQVGEAASRLSLGERQRLHVARAFLKQAPILLLDEPTSALDAESERLVLASLAELRHGRTTILVTHRLNAAAGFDRVLVLDQGRVAEFGSPAELLARPNSYLARWEG